MRNHRMESARLVACGIVLLSFVGCGSYGTPDFLGKLTPVEGIVKVNGKPMQGVQVTFVPYQGIRGNKADQSVRLATAVTDDNGKYSLMTPPGGAMQKSKPDLYAGILPGKYAATFSCWVLPDGKPWVAMGEKMDRGPVAMGAVEKLPAQLGNPLTTPHVVDIRESGNFSLDFNLKVQ